MRFESGLRLNNRQRIANAREKPVEANKNQSVDGAEGLFLRSGSPQNVYLLPQRQNFRLEGCPRPKQIYDHPNNEPDKISHPATASPYSRSTASQIEFATGTAGAGLSLPIIGKLLGHTQASTTQRYAHLDSDPLRLASDKIAANLSMAMGDNSRDQSECRDLAKILRR